MFVARFDRRIFYYTSKTDSSWGCVAKVTASHLLLARPGTSKEWMDGAKERGQGGSERREEGATERGRREREEHGRKGDREAGKLQGRYPEEDTGQQP